MAVRLSPLRDVYWGSSFWDDQVYGDGGDDEIYGFDGNDTLWGETGNDWLYGGIGNDFLYGGIGLDHLYGEAGDDHLFGESGDDTLSGAAGRDWLDGGTGADAMFGGLDDDVYVVDNIGDSVVEYANQGSDVVQSYLTSYTLPVNVERLELYGSARDAFGNSLNNEIYGNGNDNWFTGGDGNDVLDGGEGVDVLFGEGGGDWLVGGAGADVMFGGLGDDFYVVDNSGDYLAEYYGEGRDTVFSSITYTLGLHVEQLLLVDSGGAINGTGNTLDNVLYGNRYDNVLRGAEGDDDIDGSLGNDDMYGGRGDDTFHVDQAGDRVFEYSYEGNDEVIATIDYTLPANVERLTLLDSGGAISGTGNGWANVISGNASINVLSGGGDWDRLYGYGGNDTLFGGADNDSLYGGAGADSLYGGSGSDWFYFQSTADTTDGVRHDRIFDFSSAEGDSIMLGSIDANTYVAGDQAFTYIGSAAFTGVAGQLNYIGGFVQGDTNGDRVADFMIQVNAASLSASDFSL